MANLPTTVFNCNLTEQEKFLLQRIADKLETTKTGAMREMIRVHAKMHDVDLQAEIDQVQADLESG